MTQTEALKLALDALGKWSIGYHVDAVELNDLIATLEAALEQPEQDVPETDCGNMQVEWADIPKEFNDWWDADRLTQTNPFREDSPAYWAWEGWQARTALEQPEQEPHWLTKELMADYLDMIAEAISENSTEMLRHKAHWMRRGEV